MGELFNVRLVSPARIGPRRLQIGPAEVTAEELAVLQAEGLVAPDDAAEGGAETWAASTGHDWQTAVEAEARKLAGAAFDGELARLEAEVTRIMATAEAEVSEANARASARESECRELAAEVARLTALVEGPGGHVPPDPDSTDTPPSEKAAKTTPKKGAAVIPKG